MINLPTLKDKTDLLLALIDDLESKISYKQIGKVEHFSEMRKLIKSFDDVILAHVAVHQKERERWEKKAAAQENKIRQNIFAGMVIREGGAYGAVLALAPQIKLEGTQR